MKSNKRQGFVVAIAGGCLLIALWSLMSGGSSSAPIPSGEPTSPVEEPTDSNSEQVISEQVSVQITPVHYQRLREQLLRFSAEHEEPFRTVQTAQGTNKEEQKTKGSSSSSAILRVPPLTVQPAPLLTGNNISQDSPLPSPSPSQDAQTETGSTPTIRLRGVIRNRETREVSALIEVNGRVVRATQDPDAEWQLVSLSQTQLVVRHENQTYTVEVSHAK